MNPKTLHRFIDKVCVLENGCWLWMASQTGFGYGFFWPGAKGISRRAHRVAYEHWVGVIPEGMQLDHLCRNRLCVNPFHLEIVTNKENGARGLRSALKTHCAKGHDWIPENISVRPNGSRFCRICNADRALASYYKKKGKK